MVVGRLTFAVADAGNSRARLARVRTLRAGWRSIAHLAAHDRPLCDLAAGW